MVVLLTLSDNAVFADIIKKVFGLKIKYQSRDHFR